LLEVDGPSDVAGPSDEGLPVVIGFSVEGASVVTASCVVASCLCVVSVILCSVVGFWDWAKITNYSIFDRERLDKAHLLALELLFQPEQW